MHRHYCFTQKIVTNMENIEKQLRTEIRTALQNVNETNCPNLYKRLSQKGGYLQVEEMIINMVINDHITPSSCIPQLESEL